MAINGQRPMQIKASYQQKNKEIANPPPNANNPSKIGPTLSDEAVLTIAVSDAMEDVRMPVWFSLRSNHPIFFYKIFKYRICLSLYVTFSLNLLNDLLCKNTAI